MDELEEIPKTDRDMPIPHQYTERTLAAVVSLTAAILVQKLYVRWYFKNHDEEDQSEDE